MRLISNPRLWGAVRQCLVLTVALLALSCSLIGCLEDPSQETGPDLVVTYQATNATIFETFEEGQLTGRSVATLSFGFGGTTSVGALSTFGVERLDGQSIVTVDAEDNDNVTMAFEEHGLHQLVLFAEDENGRSSTTVTVRIELSIEWVETGTNDPMTMTMNTAPKEGGTPASALFIESTVENPALINNIGGGQDVDVTWSLLDETHGTCQRNEATIDDGDSETWRTVHFNTVEAHELVVDYDGGQDTVDVHHRINVLHEALESPPSL